MLKQKLLIALVSVGFVGGGLYSLALNKAEEKPLFEMKIEDTKKPVAKLVSDKKPAAIKNTETVAPKIAMTFETVVPKVEEQKKIEPIPVSEPEPVVITEPAPPEALVQTVENTPEPSLQTQPPAASEAEPVKVLIVEIMFDAAGADSGQEYIRIFNPTNTDINMENWSLKNGDTSLAKIGSKAEDKLVVKAQSYFIFGFYGNQSADLVRSAQLPNGAATIKLFTDSGGIIDEASYDGALLEEGESWKR